MTDILGRMIDAEADVAWLRVERDRLADEVSRAHKDALDWMEKAAVANAEIERLRSGLLRHVQYDNKCDQTGVPCCEPGRCSCYLEAGTWLE